MVVAYYVVASEADSDVWQYWYLPEVTLRRAKNARKKLLERHPDWKSDVFFGRVQYAANSWSRIEVQLAIEGL